MTKIEKKFVNSRRRAQRNLKLVDELLGWIDLSDVTKVLEIGCGTGVVAAHLCNNYKLNVVGTDLDPEEIAIARKYNKESESLNFAEADATKLPFANTEFDMVLSFKVMHHIGGWDRALKEIGRVLTPKGFFVFNDIAGSRLTTRILKGIVKNYGVYTFNDITDFLERNNFDIVHQEKPRGIILKHCSIVSQKN